MPPSRVAAGLALFVGLLAVGGACAKSDAITPPGGDGPSSGGGDGGPGPGGASGATTAGSAGGDDAGSTSSGDGGGDTTSTSATSAGGAGGDASGGTTSSGAACGNGTVDDGEDCDGDDLGAATCTSEGFAGGTLACAGCAFDTSGCSDVATCDNGLDDDDDGLVDEDDPGCTSPSDDDELVFAPDCMGAGTPVVDLTTVEGLTVTWEGTTDDAGVIVNDFTSTAGGACPSAPGPEVAFHFVVSETIATLVLSLDNPGTETDWDPVLYVRSATCTGTQVGCNDDSGGGVLASTLVLSNVQPGAYFIFVDGKTAADVGDFELTITPS